MPFPGTGVSSSFPRVSHTPQGSSCYFHLPAPPVAGSSPVAPRCWGSRDGILPDLAARHPNRSRQQERVGVPPHPKAITSLTLGSNLDEKPQSSQPNGRKQTNARSPARRSRQHKWQASPCPARRPQAPRGSFRTGDRGVRGAPGGGRAAPGGGRGTGRRCLLPPGSLFTSAAKVTAPPRFPSGAGLDAGGGS